ncbi:hypothetical protein VTO73DRAFT_15196 [Trametes versicolor]
MQTSRLPFDIYLEIIDAVAADRDQHLRRATLAACALTEKPGLPKARAHLYRKVVLHEDVEFLAFSMRYSPTLCSGLRSAVYEHDGGEFVYDALVPFLRELAARPSLRTLELGCITFLRPGDIADILAGAPHLTRLCVSTCLYYDYERSGIVLPLNEDSRMAPQYCRDLRAVVVSANPPTWLSVSAQSELMQFMDNENMDSLLDMLPAHCTITHLTLGPIWREPDPFFQASYTDEHQNQFKALPDYCNFPTKALERLVLLVVNTGAWTADALAKVRAPGLQTLALFCWYKGTRWRPALADLPLRGIDALLATDVSRGLQRVFVTVYCRCDGSSDTTRVRVRGSGSATQDLALTFYGESISDVRGASTSVFGTSPVNANVRELTVFHIQGIVNAPLLNNLPRLATLSHIFYPPHLSVPCMNHAEMTLERNYLPPLAQAFPGDLQLTCAGLTALYLLSCTRDALTNARAILESGKRHGRPLTRVGIDCIVALDLDAWVLWELVEGLDVYFYDAPGYEGALNVAPEGGWRGHSARARRHWPQCPGYVQYQSLGCGVRCTWCGAVWARSLSPEARRGT